MLKEQLKKKFKRDITKILEEDELVINYKDAYEKMDKLDLMKEYHGMLYGKYWSGDCKALLEVMSDKFYKETIEQIREDYF